MRRNRKDIQQDILLALIRPLVNIWMRIDAKRKVLKGDGVSFKRKEPYIMLANHTFMFDVVHVPLRLKIVPFIIASQTLFTKQPAKFLVTQVAHVIPKSKGRSDLKTIKSIYDAVKRGYPILIFPEGDTTFYGETGHIEESTMKLIKKLKLDVITCNVRGGYLSKPRWATGKRKRHQIELFYDLTIKKEDLQQMTVEQISDVVHKALYHNDYEYQRQKMIPHPGKNLAEGIENVVYVCPHCEAINTIVSEQNKIICTACKSEGSIDKFGFIQGFKFDNLIDWNHFQRNYHDKLRKSIIETEGFLSYLTMENETQIPIGKVQITYKDGEIRMTGAKNITIPIEEISNATITLRRDFGFMYEDTHYLIKLDQFGASFLRIIQDKY